MVRVEFRPTVAADLKAIAAAPLPHRIKAITAVIDDQIVGVGGLGFRPDGTVIAFAELTPALKRYPAAVHRAGKLGMALIRRSGVPLVIAEAQPGNPAAERWLERFGFERMTVGGAAAYVWRRETPVAAVLPVEVKDAS